MSNESDRYALQYRPDIDGLRAIAVLSVVFYHTFPDFFAGGFIGVDIFFVISGYLISQIIFLDLEKNNGRFGYAEFYQKRIKRIFPALILVLSTCLLLGSVELFSDEYEQLGKHVWSSSVFISNFILWRESGYFDTAADLKPLLHLWSLGVEEQFYIFWPFIVALAWKRKNLLKITLTLIIISMLLNLWRINKFPIETFFLPFARIWELLAGGLLAYATHIKRAELSRIRENADLSNVLSLAGVGLLIIPMLLSVQKNLYPGIYAIMPVIGTLLLLVSNNSFFNSAILGNKWIVYIGKISYPLYLWHWPLLSFLYIFNRADPLLKLSAVALSFILAALTYAFIETPIRKPAIRNYRPATVLLTCLLTLGITGKIIEINGGFKNRLFKYEAEIAQISNKKSSAYASPECLDRFGLESAFCVGNFKDPNVLLIGDSQANALVPMLTNSTMGSAFLNLGQGGCPATFGIHTTATEKIPVSQSDQDNCIRTTTLIKDLLRDPRIETVIFFNFYGRYFDHRFKTASDTGERFRYETSLTDTFSEIVKAGKRLIVVLPVPEIDHDVKTCITPRPFFIFGDRGESNCAIKRQQIEASQKNIRDFLTRLSGKMPIALFDPLPYLCDDANCYIKNPGGTILYKDPTHISVNGAEILGQHFSDWYSDRFSYRVSSHP